MVTKQLLSLAQSRWVIKLEWPCGKERGGVRARRGGIRRGRMVGKIQRYSENTKGLKKGYTGLGSVEAGPDYHRRG